MFCNVASEREMVNTMSERSFKTEERYIELRNLAVVWPDAQRPFNRKRAERIAAEFDPDKFMPPKVTLPNGNGIYHICEGQHRTAAARIYLGDDSQKILCLMAAADTPARAAEIFLGINTDVDPVNKIAKFRVAVTAKRPDEVAIDLIVRHNGYRVDSSHNHDTIGAVDALKFVYNKGKRTLERTLHTLRQTWGGDANAVTGPLLRGYGTFICEYSEQIDWKRLSELLRKKYTPGELLNAIKGHKELHRISAVEAAVELIKAAYNKGLPTEKRLKRKTQED